MRATKHTLGPAAWRDKLARRARILDYERREREAEAEFAHKMLFTPKSWFVTAWKKSYLTGYAERLKQIEKVVIY